MKKTLVTFVGALLGFGMIPMLMGPSGGYPSNPTFQNVTLVNTLTGGKATLSTATDQALSLNSAATNSDIQTLCANGQTSGSRCWNIRLGGVNDLIFASANDGGVGDIATNFDLTRNGQLFLTQSGTSGSTLTVSNSSTVPTTAVQINGTTSTNNSYGLTINAGTSSSDAPFRIFDATGTFTRMFLSGTGQLTQTGDNSNVHNGSINAGDTSGVKAVLAGNVGNTGEASLIANASGGQAACVEANNTVSVGNCSTPAGHAGLATTGTMNLDPANGVLNGSGYRIPHSAWGLIQQSSPTVCGTSNAVGFSTSCTVAGVVTLSFSPAFSSAPNCAITPIDASGVALSALISAGPSGSSEQIVIRNTANTPVQSSFFVNCAGL